MLHSRSALLRFALIGIAAAPGFAQLTSAGAVSGQVTDEQAASIEGAAVTLRDTSTGSKQTVTLRRACTKSQWATWDSKSRACRASACKVGSTLTLNVKLELGATTTVVDGQATGPRRVNLGLRIFF